MKPRSLLSIVAAMLLAATHAHAAPTDCATPEEMTARLKAEGQRSIAMAEHLPPDKVLRGMIVTMNADRSVGYILQTDRPTGERASTICVWARLESLRLFDARKPGLRPEALFKASDEEALRRCDELAAAKQLRRDSCNAFNRIARSVEPHGDRVAVQGFITERQADGSYKPTGTLATVSGRVGGRFKDDPEHPGRAVGGALIYSSVPDGASVINAVLAFVDYTPYGLSLIEGR